MNKASCKKRSPELKGEGRPIINQDRIHNAAILSFYSKLKFFNDVVGENPTL